ncbi:MULTISPECIES: anaerobic carbon-monoxide dehydrogenase catalytic subunit [Pelosinus]|uniref:Carbon monoxide dehydrogenase n=1 Tax=Pelosinus fermentans B4 TaxID=1149862 RepID=I9L5K4_9FIRM|nr:MULTISPECIES: anaerobic carbon-monoxide dehydrogenase catalytic subunit [Pelosinus]EIW15501.1 carbon-monoxide dehydrogenase, catalytic subunit [Pelosinus fermentans B4]EIW26808.1 carbon-monoxide dehydrogenase, catalytic subunit [Pelosinus fermentans A11]OAM92242.1 carbon-monoxide dehydrogenase, catalytic subunit [Pelosinus fermentans DSM 17108]SDQ38087.1 Ni-dependent carbon monoxide dehydrogenase precursor [Pelosinus fermentans]
MPKAQDHNHTQRISLDHDFEVLYEKACEAGIETAFSRAKQTPVPCPFGSAGVCCRHCLEGPCRIGFNGKGPQEGICGANGDTIVARNLLTMMIEGAAGHAEHGRETALALLEASEGNSDYQIKGVEKLYQVAAGLGIETNGKAVEDIGKQVALKALEDFQKQAGAMNWLTLHAQQQSIDKWDELGITPVNVHLEISKAVTRTSMGCDADPVNLLLGCLTMGLVDGFGGLHLSSDLQDILFGVPKLVKSNFRLGVIKKEMVNIAVHGHVPLLSEKIVEWSRKLSEEAKAAGAAGINVVGICCSGNEVLMRHGIPAASSFSSQELVIVTGMLEAMVVDVQCIMPGIQKVAECYHTEIITTLPYVNIAGSTHVDFHTDKADKAAQDIVRKAIANFPKREHQKITSFTGTVEAYAGFSNEQIIEALSALNKEDPLKPLLDAIASGAIRGVAAIVGCTNVREFQDWGNVTVAKELLKNNVLVVATGCSAHSLAKHNLMNMQGLEYCGESLRGVLKAIGQAVGLESLPPTLHMGSCVDNSRPADLLTAVANRLGVEVKDLPAVGSCPETHSPKALVIGTYFLANGVDVHVGVNPQVSGSQFVTDVLCNGAKDDGLNLEKLFGGKLIYEKDPVKAAAILLRRIEEKRLALGLSSKLESGI